MLLKVIILAVVQGVTEFLPVSSSGHLVFLQNYFNIHENQMLLDVVLHGGTLFSILFFFRKDIVFLIKGMWGPSSKETWRFFGFVFIGIIPAGMIGIFFDSWIESRLFLLWVVQAAWILNGLNLIYLDGKIDRGDELNWRKSCLIGFFQVLAFIPGISRSGTTIATGVYSGVSREKAARFSFLMAIPVLAGALLLKTGDVFNGRSHFPEVYLLAGFLVSFIFGLVALKILYRLLTVRKMKWMGLYCILLSLISLVINIF